MKSGGRGREGGGGERWVGGGGGSRCSVSRCSCLLVCLFVAVATVAAALVLTDSL